MLVIETITAAISPVIEESGNILEEVTLTPDGSSKLLTIIIDNENSLNLDQITVATKAISAVIDQLDENGAFGDQPFTLEVTTPGLDRPLTQPRHWKKNLGRLIHITKKSGGSVKGRIGELTSAGVIIDENEVPFADIERAMIEIEFKKVGA